MVKQKLTAKEEELIESQLKQFVKPKSLPDILRKAILSNKWVPEKYQIYVPKGDIDEKEHFIVAEDAIQAFENNSMSELDKLAITRILNVPKIERRIDYEFRGLVTRVKNAMIEGADALPQEDEKIRLHEKTEEISFFGKEKKPMKGVDAKPIVNVGEGSKFGELEIKNDTTDKESSDRDTSTRGKDSGDSTGNTESRAETGETGAKSRGAGISFDEEDEDY